MGCPAYADRVQFHNDINVMEVDFSDFTFDTSRQVNAFYDVIDQLLEETGRRWFFLVNYKDCKVLPEAWVAFANRGKKVNLAYSLGTVRFEAADETEQTIIEKSKSDSFDANLFTSRDAALKRLADMREAFLAKGA